MKIRIKLFILLLLMFATISLTGCELGKCEQCGNFAILEKVSTGWFGMDLRLCSSCAERYKRVAENARKHNEKYLK